MDGWMGQMLRRAQHALAAEKSESQAMESKADRPGLARPCNGEWPGQVRF